MCSYVVQEGYIMCPYLFYTILSFLCYCLARCVSCSFDFQGINILKAHGKSARENYLLNALNTGRVAQGMPIAVSIINRK
jgi:hypothetical protein